MDENLNTTDVVEDTTPVTETVEGDAPAADPTPAETPETEQQTDTTPDAAENTEQTQSPATSFLPVKFRHEMKDLNREDAAKYAQMGLLREAEQPMMEDLALMAAAQGKSTAEFIRSLKEADEAGLMEEKLNITGGDREAAEILVKAEMEKRRAVLGVRAKEAAEAEQKAEKDVTDRLAGEFVELQVEFPQLTDPNALPREVMEDAVRNNRHLLDAYLRYERREAKKIEQSRADATKAAAASAGSQADNPPTGDVVADTIRASVRSVFN